MCLDKMDFWILKMVLVLIVLHFGICGVAIVYCFGQNLWDVKLRVYDVCLGRVASEQSFEIATKDSGGVYIFLNIAG